MSKDILVVVGFLFLIILFLGNVSAQDDWCWFALNSADCMGTSGGQVVMDLSSSTNAHGALAGQGSFAGVLCCNFGEGDTSCTGNNKILGLSSSTNAHAEIPDLVSPNYNNDVCYDSLKTCRSTDVSCAINEVEVLYISDTTNAHIEGAGQSQNYNSKICCVVELPSAECDLTSAIWQYEEVIEGANVDVIVDGTGCSGETISFAVLRRKAGPDEPCNSIEGCENPANVVFGPGSNSVTGTWTAAPYHDKEYYFVATVVATGETISSTPDLLVTGLPSGFCSNITICNQYDTENYCNPDPCEVAEVSVPTDIDCDDPDINCECIWENNECQAGWGGFSGICNDGVINPGETCDGSDWGSITGCNNFDVFTGGDLSCVDCQFNTNLCTGGTMGGYCGDGVINPSETCDGSDWGPITNCSDFDIFTGGILMCEDCQFDTLQCTGPGEIGAEIGICIYTQFTDDTCDDDGFLTFDWTAEWVWAEGMGPEDDVKGLHLNCVDGQKTVECPAQIPLPFFNIYSFIATLSIIALIYVILILRKEKRKR